MKHGLPKPDEPAQPKQALLDKYNRLRAFAAAAVIAFGSDTEAQAIGDLGKLLAEED